jgi:Ssp1 endopeptidase immunity protein Rap1a
MLKRFGLLALTLFLCTPAHSETGDGLLQACEALEREIRISGDNIWLPNRPDVHKCWGYIGAVQDFSTIVVEDNKTGKPLFNSCPDPKTTLTQLIRVFTNYARTHPQELHEKASLLVYRAMLGAFPCP